MTLHRGHTEQQLKRQKKYNGSIKLEHAGQCDVCYRSSNIVDKKHYQLQPFLFYSSTKNGSLYKINAIYSKVDTGLKAEQE